MADDILHRVKLALRINHDKLDQDLQADIDACLADLELCGVENAPVTDPLIFNAVKLWCRSLYTDDPTKSAAYMQRYDALKASLMGATGYGREADADA